MRFFVRGFRRIREEDREAFCSAGIQTVVLNYIYMTHSHICVCVCDFMHGTVGVVCLFPLCVCSHGCTRVRSRAEMMIMMMMMMINADPRKDVKCSSSRLIQLSEAE